MPLKLTSEIDFGKYEGLGFTMQDLISQDKGYAWYIASHWTGKVSKVLLSILNIKPKNESKREARLRDLIEAILKDKEPIIDWYKMARTNPEYAMDLISDPEIKIPLKLKDKITFLIHRKTDILY